MKNVPPRIKKKRNNFGYNPGKGKNTVFYKLREEKRILPTILEGTVVRMVDDVKGRLYKNLRNGPAINLGHY